MTTSSLRNGLFTVVSVWVITSARLLAVPPAIVSVSPDRGSTDGGTLVTITGTGFTGTTGVFFDSALGTGLVIVDDTTIRVNTPAHVAGAALVRVVDNEGTAIFDSFTFGSVPIVLDDSYTTQFNTPLDVPAPGVLANDDSNGGGDVTVALVADVSAGTLSLNANGGFTYTPPGGFLGSVTFSYRATNPAGDSRVAYASILITPATGPQPPQDLRVAAMDGNNVTFRWTPSPFGVAATSFIIEGGINPAPEALAVIPVGAAPTATLVVPSGTFYIRVKAVNSDGISGPSNEIRIFVNQPVPPATPENLLALANGADVVLTWRNNLSAGNPASIAVDVTGATVASLTLPSSSETFAFSGVPAGTYTFAVREVNASGSSAQSNSVTLTFPATCTGAPLTPASFVAYRVGNTLFIVWQPGATGPAPTSYVVNVTGSFTGAFPTTARQLSGSVGPGTYSFTVTAVNPCGFSAPTATRSVTVPLS